MDSVLYPLRKLQRALKEQADFIYVKQTSLDLKNSSLTFSACLQEQQKQANINKQELLNNINLLRQNLDLERLPFKSLNLNEMVHLYIMLNSQINELESKESPSENLVNQINSFLSSLDYFINLEITYSTTQNVEMLPKSRLETLGSINKPKEGQPWYLKQDIKIKWPNRIPKKDSLRDSIEPNDDDLVYYRARYLENPRALKFKNLSELNRNSFNNHK
jgi:hypothetical protein